MTAPKRTTPQRNEDLPFIAELYVKGYPQVEIASRLNKERDYDISRQTIARDIKSIEKRWLKSQVRDFDIAKAKEIAKLDVMEIELWREWERSKLPKTVTVNEAIQRRGEDEAGKNTASSKKMERVEGRLGNVAYMREVREIIDMRLRILGLYAPELSMVGVVDLDKLDALRKERWGDGERIYKEAIIVGTIIDQSNGQAEQEPEDATNEQ